MEVQSDYTAGTITLTNGSINVTGAGTAWQTAPTLAGDIFFNITGAGGNLGVIATITGEGAATLTKNWEGPTLSGVGYHLRFQSGGSRVLAEARNLIELLGGGTLSSLAALTPAADEFPYWSGSATAVLGSVTSQARSLLDDTSFAAMLTTLGAVPLAGGAMTGADQWNKGAGVASATELLVLTDGNYFDVTGTGTVTSIETTADEFAIGSVIKLHALAAWKLVHHATNLVLPGGTDITMKVGGEVELVKYASGDWRLTNHMRGDVNPSVQNIIKMHVFNSTTDYIRTAETEGSISDSFVFTPASTTSRFSIIAIGRVRVYHVSGGNDARADTRLSYYDTAGAAYIAQESLNLGVVNVTPFGSGSVLYSYLPIAFMADASQSIVLYGASADRVLLRLRGECGYASNELNIYDWNITVWEYEP